ncbi:type I-E CRISPR-associated protein Cas6/Cse3/CasE [Candidatus Foliamicus sp.]
MFAFNRWAGARGFIHRGTFDEGLALHVLLSSMFGKSVMQPFRLFSSPRKRAASLYAYANMDHAMLKEMAESVATPDCLEILDLMQLKSRPMPIYFKVGQRLGFDVRVRPIRRLSSDLSTGRGPTLKARAEVDAFVVEVRRNSVSSESAPSNGTMRQRERIYANWLKERLEGSAAVDSENCRLAAFRRTRTARGDGPGPEGPDATIHGELAVRNPEAFAKRLRTGVGRHRAYGYGMLLLRPPGRPHSRQRT